CPDRDRAPFHPARPPLPPHARPPDARPPGRRRGRRGRRVRPRTGTRCAAQAAAAAFVAGCGSGRSGVSKDPVTQISTGGGLQAKVRAALTPSADHFPATGGKTLQALANEIGGGSQMGLASSVFVAGRENRLAFGVIDRNAGFLYGPTAVYVARTPESPAKGPYPAPAD